jgi:hypothetical protein
MYGVDRGWPEPQPSVGKRPARRRRPRAGEIGAGVEQRQRREQHIARSRANIAQRRGTSGAAAAVAQRQRRSRSTPVGPGGRPRAGTAATADGGGGRALQQTRAASTAVPGGAGQASRQSRQHWPGRDSGGNASTAYQLSGSSAIPKLATGTMHLPVPREVGVVHERTFFNGSLCIKRPHWSLVDTTASADGGGTAEGGWPALSLSLWMFPTEVANQTSHRRGEVDVGGVRWRAVVQKSEDRSWGGAAPTAPAYGHAAPLPSGSCTPTLLWHPVSGRLRLCFARAPKNGYAAAAPPATSGACAVDVLEAGGAPPGACRRPASQPVAGGMMPHPGSQQHQHDHHGHGVPAGCASPWCMTMTSMTMAGMTMASMTMACAGGVRPRARRAVGARRGDARWRAARGTALRAGSAGGRERGPPHSLQRG